MRHKRLGGALLGLAAFLILSGGMLAIAGVALGGRTSIYNYEHSNTPTLETVADVSIASYTNIEAFQKIEVDVGLGDVYFSEADSYGIEVTWSDERIKLNYEIVDGKLRVWNEGNALNGPSMRNLEATAYIYFPYDAQFEDINVKASLGDLSMDNLTVKTLTIKDDLGDVSLNGVTAGSADLRLSLGNLEGYGMNVGGTTYVDNSLGDVDLGGDFGDLDIQCDLGTATVSTSRPKHDYSYELTTSMGSIRLDGETQGDEDVSGGSGAYQLKVDNSMGDIEILFG